MTTIVAPHVAPQLRARHGFGPLAVPLAVALTVVGRLPFGARPLGGDEAGYLQVGQQWRPGGSSLYGSYWVDRPPLLVSIFNLAADLGGVVPLRIIGCVAAVLVVCGAALVAHQIAGRSAGRWAAVAAAIFLLSPMNGGIEIDGELLAAPFILAGMAAVLAALNGTWPRPTCSSLPPIGAAAAVGGCLVCAVLVKQDMATTNHHTAHVRLLTLTVSAVASGLVVVVALAARALATRRLRGPAVCALAATVTYDLVSVALGGSYWSHYLVQLIAPAAVLAGVLVARHVGTARVVVGAAALTAVAAWAVVVVTPEVSVTGNVGVDRPTPHLAAPCPGAGTKPSATKERRR